MGGEKNPKEYNGKTRIKPRLVTPPPFIIWKANCFLVSARTENKPDYPNMGSRSKLNGTKETQGRALQGIGSMDNSNVGPRSSEKRGLEENCGDKKN